MSGVTKELDILKQLFENLSDTDKQAFLTSVSSKEQVKKVIEPRKVTKCPHCQSTHFVKNGKDCGNQRFLCRDCKKSFVEQTGTILYNTQKDIEVWEKYIHCMIEKYPLRKCAEICKINLATAFTWRHKILDALQNMMNEVELTALCKLMKLIRRFLTKGTTKILICHVLLTNEEREQRNVAFPKNKFVFLVVSI